MLNVNKNINHQNLYGFNNIHGNLNVLKGEKNSFNFISGKNNKLLGNLNFFNFIYGEKNIINNNNQLYSFIFGKNNKLQEIKNDRKIKFIAGNNIESKSKYNEFNFGEFNSSNENNILTVGNGINESKRHNAFSINELGEILIQEDVAKEENGEIKYPPMISLQSLVSRIKTLEEELKALKNK